MRLDLGEMCNDSQMYFPNPVSTQHQRFIDLHGVSNSYGQNDSFHPQICHSFRLPHLIKWYHHPPFLSRQTQESSLILLSFFLYIQFVIILLALLPKHKSIHLVPSPPLPPQTKKLAPLPDLQNSLLLLTPIVDCIVFPQSSYIESITPM